ncbi:hypothetical protein H6501_01385 [Candidatus Woesearchaeota archaeon]|nr:hypothetical protein [Nanoarchaeota archaeon]MCB9370229.1 hypothetical protein [Candidatus Woesearchaeota archaeon]USN44754.1 MAG: hypothetical protein H6500_02835 [Candidatus Woesearchaeota archaeon]
MNSFQKYKQDVLGKLDKSAKGSIDKRILDLCDAINALDEAVTLSSCSGRICLLELAGRANKKDSKWIYCTHDRGELEECSRILTAYDGKQIVYFKQECAILHVCLSSVSLSLSFLRIAKESGFNRCHILSLRPDGSAVIELICSLALSVPVFDGTCLIPGSYLSYLMKLANERQEYSWLCLSKLILKLPQLGS